MWCSLAKKMVIKRIARENAATIRTQRSLDLMIWWIRNDWILVNDIRSFHTIQLNYCQMIFTSFLTSCTIQDLRSSPAGMKRHKGYWTHNCSHTNRRIKGSAYNRLCFSYLTWTLPFFHFQKTWPLYSRKLKLSSATASSKLWLGNIETL